MDDRSKGIKLKNFNEYNWFKWNIDNERKMVAYDQFIIL